MDIQEEEIKRIIELTSDPFVLEIGAMDGISYDSLYPYIMQYQLRSLMVEPLPDLFDALVANYSKNPRVIFENVAITEQAGSRDIYRIDRSTAESVPALIYSDGMSSFFLDRNALGSGEYRNNVETEEVQCMTLQQLLDRHSVNRIDVLQIDTEGYDYEILSQLDFSRYRPYIIKIETWSELTEIRASIQDLLENQGYECRHWGDDIIGTQGLDTSSS